MQWRNFYLPNHFDKAIKRDHGCAHPDYPSNPIQSFSVQSFYIYAGCSTPSGGYNWNCKNCLAHYEKYELAKKYFREKKLNQIKENKHD